MVFGLVAFLSMNSAYSACGTSVIFQHSTHGLYCSYYNYETPASDGACNMDVTLFSSYWALGSGDGNTTGDAANDCGTKTISDYGNMAGYANWVGFSGDWGDLGVDGCILWDTEDGPHVQIFDDRKTDSSMSYFAVACVERASTGIPYDMANSPYSGTCDMVGDRYSAGGIYLTEMPKPFIDSATPGTGGLDIDLSWDTNTLCGWHTDNSTLCTWANVLDSYDIYYYQGTSAPTTRVPSSWTAVSDTDGTLDDEAATVFIPDPGSGESSWLSIRLNYESNYESKYVGPNSTQIAGPTAAGGFDSIATSFIDKKTVRIDWVTNGEFAVSGFNVLHANDPLGPWDTANPYIIEAEGIGGDGASYFYVDRIKGVKGSFIHYYKVQMVSSTDLPRVESEIKSVQIRETIPKGKR